MLLSQVKDTLQAEVLVDFSPQLQVFTACGSDLISDVLRFTKARTVLLTGLPTAQMIRAAELLDLVAIVFVRGKRPTDELVQLAQTLNVPVMCTNLPLYEACGRLYQQGLQGCSEFIGKEQELD